MVRRKVRLHVGAHKTASTYIQGVLELTRPYMSAEGTAYWPLEVFRRTFRDLYDHRTEVSQSRISAIRPTLRRRGQRLAGKLKQLFDVPYDLLISEENLIGQPGQAMSGPYYRDAVDRLTLLAEYLPSADIEIYLSIRSYDKFLASCFGEALAHGTFCEIDEFVQLHRDARPAWSTLAHEILSVFPAAKLYVWRYEDFREVEDRVLEGLTRLSKDRIVKPAQRSMRPSASGKAIEETAKVARGLSCEQRILEFLAKQATYPKEQNSEAFNPWPPEVERHLAQVYSDETRTLAQRSDLVFLQSGNL